MKLEARQNTSGILADIDEALFEVSNLSAKIAFENLFPTCEIGDEIAEYWIANSNLTKEEKAELDKRWDTIGRQRNLLAGCYSQTCECQTLPGKSDILGISQPFLMNEDEFDDYRCGLLDLPNTDADALLYSVEFFGAEFAAFEIDYDRVKPVTINELQTQEDDDDDDDHW